MNVVRSTGPATAAGLQPGDLITKVDGRAVGSAAQFRGLVREKVDRAGGDPNEVEIAVTVKPPSGPSSTHIVALGNTTRATYRSPTRTGGPSPPRMAAPFR